MRITQVPRGVTLRLSSVQDLAVPDESEAVLLKTGARGYSQGPRFPGILEILLSDDFLN